MKDAKVEIIEQAVRYDGYVRVESYRLRHSLHDGGMGSPILREVVERGHSVGLLPYDPVTDAVVLIEQFRVGAFAAGRPPWTTEIVAGIIDAGETAEAVAQREAQEESGLAVDRLTRVGEVLLSPGVLTEVMTLFVGRADAGQVGGIHGLDHEDEDIRPIAVPWRRARAMLADGTIDTAPALMALQWLALNRARLRREWAARR